MLVPVMERDSMPLDAGRLPDPSLHANGDVLFHAFRRHAAVERQHLHRRAVEDRQDVHRECSAMASDAEDGEGQAT